MLEMHYGHIQVSWAQVRPLASVLLLALAGATYAGEETPEVHSKVQAALDWQLPANTCKKPQLRGAVQDIVQGGDDDVTFRYDVDSYELDRFTRKQKRWTFCVSKYKKGLLKEFEILKDCAQYGLTQQQAEIILGKMALIQSVVTSPEGVTEAQSPQS